MQESQRQTQKKKPQSNAIKECRTARALHSDNELRLLFGQQRQRFIE